MTYVFVTIIGLLVGIFAWLVLNGVFKKDIPVVDHEAEIQKRKDIIKDLNKKLDEVEDEKMPTTHADLDADIRSLL